MEQISKLKDAIEGAKNIFIASHMNPDGDNLGSIMGLYNSLLLKKLNVTVICDDVVGMEYRFLPKIDQVKSYEEVKDLDVDLFISLDSADENRLGSVKTLYEKAKTTVNIDHHGTNAGYGDINILDATSPATGEVLYQVLKNMDYPIDSDVATCLYTAISTDTGSFKYDSVKSSTHRTIADLIDKGIDLKNININLYQRKSIIKTKLLIGAMNTLEFHCNNSIGIVEVSKELFNSVDAVNGDSDGIVEFVRDIDTIEVSVLLKEKEDCVRLSLRSKSTVDCSKIAGAFNGGGHIRAAGATLYMDLKSAKEAVLEELKKELCKE